MLASSTVIPPASKRLRRGGREHPRTIAEDVVMGALDDPAPERVPGDRLARTTVSECQNRMPGESDASRSSLSVPFRDSCWSLGAFQPPISSPARSTSSALCQLAAFRCVRRTTPRLASVASRCVTSRSNAANCSSRAALSPLRGWHYSTTSPSRRPAGSQSTSPRPSRSSPTSRRERSRAAPTACLARSVSPVSSASAAMARSCTTSSWIACAPSARMTSPAEAGDSKAEGDMRPI